MNKKYYYLTTDGKVHHGPLSRNNEKFGMQDGDYSTPDGMWISKKRVFTTAPKALEYKINYNPGFLELLDEAMKNHGKVKLYDRHVCYIYSGGVRPSLDGCATS